MNTLAVHLKNCLVMCTCDKNDIHIVHESPVNTQHCNYPDLSSLNQSITQWVKHEQFSNVLVVPL